MTFIVASGSVSLPKHRQRERLNREPPTMAYHLAFLFVSEPPNWGGPSQKIETRPSFSAPQLLSWPWPTSQARLSSNEAIKAFCQNGLPNQMQNTVEAAAPNSGWASVTVPQPSSSRVLNMAQASKWRWRTVKVPGLRRFLSLGPLKATGCYKNSCAT